MAPLKVRKPAAVMFDLITTTTKSHFMDQILFPYIRKNCKSYLVNNWANDVIQADVTLLRKAAAADKNAPPIEGPSAEASKQQISVSRYVIYALDNMKDSEGMTQFRFHVIFDGYAKGHLVTPLYGDVALQIHHWTVEDKVSWRTEQGPSLGPKD